MKIVVFNPGVQICGLFFGIFLRNQETKVVPELNFAWASDSIEN
jgi:hypothetical protein